jgi:TPP-dependent pyruvate/acetoin dehydrogenase alpha subunit
MSAIVDPRSSLSDLTRRIAAAERRLMRQRAHVGKFEREERDGSDANALLELMTSALKQMRDVEATLCRFSTDRQAR